MSWLYLALFAYFLNAIAFVIDKYLLSSSISHPFAYAFGVSILSLLSLVLIPFGVAWHGLNYFLLAMSSGATFFWALLFLYRSVKQSDLSIATTSVGAFTAIFSYIFSILVLQEKLVLNNSFAFIFLTAGILLLGVVKKDIFRDSLVAGIFFGLSLVLLKWTFNGSDFINGIFWTRMGFVGVALLALFFSRARKEIHASFKNASSGSRILFVVNKVVAGVGFLVLYYSIRLGEVSLVNALMGFQFVFVFVLALVLGRVIPGVSENVRCKIFLSKVLGIALTGIGFLLLFK